MGRPLALIVGVENSQQIAEVGVDEHRVLTPAKHVRSIPRWLQSGLGVPDPARIANQRIDQEPEFDHCASLDTNSWHLFPVSDYSDFQNYISLQSVGVYGTSFLGGYKTRPYTVGNQIQSERIYDNCSKSPAI